MIRKGYGPIYSLPYRGMLKKNVTFIALIGFCTGVKEFSCQDLFIKKGRSIFLYNRASFLFVKKILW